jgi:hypothetical protein
MSEQTSGSEETRRPLRLAISVARLALLMLLWLAGLLVASLLICICSGGGISDHAKAALIAQRWSNQPVLSSLA